jgi:hypothetical protein
MARGNLSENRVFLALTIGRNDDADRPPDYLFGAVAEHPLGRPVPGNDRALQIFADYCVVGRLHHFGEMTTCNVERELGHVLTESL